jgi:uncharacterized membrane protein YfcA
MYIYLPIAEMPANVLLFLAMGCAIGFLSGLFGVGGGFLLTPLLIFSGIPAVVAVGTGMAQIVASSVSGAVSQYRRNNVDIKLGAVLLSGGAVGSVIGVNVVKILRLNGHLDLFVALGYVTFLGVIGTLMLIESISALKQSATGHGLVERRSGQHNWIHGLPFKMRFHRSKLYISVIPPLMIGAFVGLLGALLGAGGGFIMVPAMIYLLRVPTNVVVGTTLFQTVFVAGLTTILHAIQNHNVDVVLAMLLIVSGVIGAQYGTVAGARLKGEQMRFLLAALVLLVCFRIGWDLVVTPRELYSIAQPLGGK